MKTKLFISFLIGVVAFLLNYDLKGLEIHSEYSMDTELHAEEKSIHIISGTKMTMDYQVLIGKKVSENEDKEINEIIETTFHEINSIYNKWNPQSEISIINRAKSNCEIDISPQLENFLKFVNKIVVLSEGRFDPTIEPLQQLWKSKLEKGIHPESCEISELLPTIGWTKIHFGSGKFKKDHDQVSLDLGGIAKGYCVDLLVERLVQAGFKDVFVNWSGEIRANGKHPENRPWKVMVSRLDNDDPNKAIAFIDLTNQAVATSGDYIQNWKIKQNGDEITYFHIINPHSGRPLVASRSSIASATIVGPSCALADALATVTMMFPNIEEAIKWSEKIQVEYPNVLFKFYSREQN